MRGASNTKTVVIFCEPYRVVYKNKHCHTHTQMNKHNNNKNTTSLTTHSFPGVKVPDSHNNTFSHYRSAAQRQRIPQCKLAESRIKALLSCMMVTFSNTDTQTHTYTNNLSLGTGRTSFIISQVTLSTRACLPWVQCDFRLDRQTDRQRETVHSGLYATQHLPSPTSKICTTQHLPSTISK